MRLWTSLGIVGLLALFDAGVASAQQIHRPKLFRAEQGALIVVIHGCLQSAESLALGTGFNQIADRNNLLVFYPQVRKGAHPLDCWSWYLPENQSPYSGELQSLASEIFEIQRREGVETRPTFLVGISSGGATAAGLAACFPEKFHGLGIVAAPSYGLARNLEEARRVLRDGPDEKTKPNPLCQPGKFTGRVISVNGLLDDVVNPKHGERVVGDFAPGTQPGPVIEKFRDQVRYQIKDFRKGLGAKGRLILIDGLKHAWPGFDLNLRNAAHLGPRGPYPTQIPFFTEHGPSATNLIWEFFSERP